jgi:hypothetical protein
VTGFLIKKNKEIFASHLFGHAIVSTKANRLMFLPLTEKMEKKLQG